MSQGAALLLERLERLRGESLSSPRVLALFSAAVALADRTAMNSAIDLAKRAGVSRDSLYEVVLQSYLFLGFPRMLGAGEILHEVWPKTISDPTAESNLGIHSWRQRGEQLYAKVYGDNAARLRDRVASFAPEILDWMLVEGYGKVLSRPQLDLVSRELSIVAFLIVDNRPKQLMSHLRGATRVGATNDQILEVVNDLAEVAGSGYAETQSMLRRLGIA
jgi:4-carboxymuconolactone decarboxylase